MFKENEGKSGLYITLINSLPSSSPALFSHQFQGVILCLFPHSLCPGHTVGLIHESHHDIHLALQQVRHGLQGEQPLS